MRWLHCFLLNALLIMVSTTAFTQNVEDSDWHWGIGTHSIDHTASNPVNGIFEVKDYSLLLPKVTVSKKINSSLSIDFQNSIGKIDNKKFNIKNKKFILSGIGLRYQLTNGLVLPKNPWIDSYIRLGVNYGYYDYSSLLGQKNLTIYNNNYATSKKVTLDRDFAEKNHNLIFNGGIGINFWIKPSLGINIESQYAYNYRRGHNTRAIDFLNHSVSLIFKFGNNYYDSYNEELEEDNDFSTFNDLGVFNIEDQYLYKAQINSIPKISVSHCSKIVTKKKVSKKCKCYKKPKYIIKLIKGKYHYSNYNKCNQLSSNVISICNKNFKYIKKFTSVCNYINVSQHNQCVISKNVILLDDYINKFNSSHYNGLKCKIREFKKKCPKILFNVNQFKLDARLKKIVNQVYKLMKQYPNYVFIVEGHADKSGNFMKNKALSLNRSESFVKLLEAKGISSDRLFVIGCGSSFPIDKNSTKKGKKNNRRLEIKLGMYKSDFYNILRK